LDGYYGAQQLRNDFGVSFDGEDWNAIQYATLTLSFPLFTGFSQRNQVKASEAAHEQARQALERRREESAAFDRSLVARRSLYLEQTQTTHESYTLAQTNSAAALRNYEQGVTGLEDYLNARDEERNAEAAYLNALLEYYQLISTYLSREA
ncbi:MAG: TolC family protein, partial [Myxococcota bacterium]